MEFIKIFLMVFIPILIGIGLYWCFRKIKAFADVVNAIGQAENAVERRLGYPKYIKFSPLWKTSAKADGNTLTVKGWVEIKDKYDENERHEYSVDVIVSKLPDGKNSYRMEYLNID